MGLTDIFTGDAKVVISPDKMRAWVMLPPPPKGQQYTAEAIREWLPGQGVVYGARDGMVQKAAAAGKYYEMLEVARGDEPTAPVGGGYTLRVEKIPFSGLRGNPDGSLFYDDLSFLQEAAQGAVLADINPAQPGAPGRAVTGEEVPPPEPEADKVLMGSGFAVSEDGRHAVAPQLCHVSVINDQLVAVPLLKLEQLAAADGPVQFDGNVMVTGDVQAGSALEATGSIFVVGRCDAAAISAGRNLLLCQGMRSQGGYGKVAAKENVWGLCFESVDIKAGGDICANHLTGCEAKCQGRALVLGGRGLVSATTLYAKGGVIAAVLGDAQGTRTTVSAGMESDLLERGEMIEKKLQKLNADIQSVSQNMTAIERINRQKPDKGKNDPSYKEMVAKREQMRSVLTIIEGERTRLKRTIDQFSATSIIARERAYPGVTIIVDTRGMDVAREMDRVKFKRRNDVVEASMLTSGR